MNSKPYNVHRTMTMIAAVLLVVLAALNLISALTAVNPGSSELTQPAEQVDEGVANDAALEDELVEDIGGLTSNTGIAVIVISLLMIVIAVGLFTGRGWQLGGMLALGADISFKLLNIIAQLAIGDPITDYWLPIAFILVEAVAIGLLFRDWNRNRAYAPVTQVRTAARTTTTPEEGV
jgi:uncharacterized membrane protein